jgi:hypothetical protein
MLTNSRLGARFGRDLRQLRSDVPLSEDQMRAAAPSIFADLRRRAVRRRGESHHGHAQ